MSLFIKRVFPDIESYLLDKLSLNISRSQLEAMTYSELERQFKIFIIRNYSAMLDKYLVEETKHTNMEPMKELVLSTISITLNVVDADNQKLNESDYFIFFRNIINKIQQI